VKLDLGLINGYPEAFEKDPFINEERFVRKPVEFA